MRLYLIRHAESANNRLYNGEEFEPGRTPDPELTDLGHLQCRQLAEFLVRADNEPCQHPYITAPSCGLAFTHLYCSLMIRSIQTATYIADACRLPLQATSNLFEKYGVYDEHNGARRGLTGPGREYFEKRFPELKLPADINPDGWHNRPAETEQQFSLRVQQAIERLLVTHGDTEDAVAWVVHGDFIDQCLNEIMEVKRHALNYHKDWAANWACHNTSISRIDFLDKARSVVYLNRLDHLSAKLVSC